MTFDLKYRSTQSKYRKIFKNKNGNDNSILGNEIRIKGHIGSKVKKYVDYGIELLNVTVSSNNSTTDSTSSLNSFGYDNNDSLFSVGGGSINGSNSNSNSNNNSIDDDTKSNQVNNVKCINKKFQTIVLKASGHAINNAVLTAEIIKRRVPGLHQKIKCDTIQIIDDWEPIEEGLSIVSVSRRVASMEITLSLDDNKIEEMKHSIGYQEPISLYSIYSIDNPNNINIIMNNQKQTNIKKQNKKKKNKKRKRNKKKKKNKDNKPGNVNGNGSVNVGITYKNPKSGQQPNNIRVENTFGYSFTSVNNTHIIRSQSEGIKSGKEFIGNNNNNNNKNNSDGY